MEPINVNLSCDIQQPVKVRYLDGYFFSKDSAGHKINVDVFNNGVPVSVGGSVSAEVIRSDGETVPVTGAVSENRAYVILPQAAYAVVGAVQITIKVTEGTTIVTIACFVAYVHESDTEITVDPGTIIPSIQALISQIETAVASIPADYSSLWTSLAPAFSSSTAYAVGQYVTNSGVLYRFTTAHPAGTWNSAHVTAVNLGAEVYNLKSAFNESNTALADLIGFTAYKNNFQTGSYTESGPPVTANTGRAYCIFENVSKGSKIYFDATKYYVNYYYIASASDFTKIYTPNTWNNTGEITLDYMNNGTVFVQIKRAGSSAYLADLIEDINSSAYLADLIEDINSSVLVYCADGTNINYNGVLSGTTLAENNKIGFYTVGGYSTSVMSNMTDLPVSDFGGGYLFNTKIGASGASIQQTLVEYDVGPSRRGRTFRRLIGGSWIGIGQYKWVAFGDSITHGSYSSSTGQTLNEYTHSYAYRIAKAIKQQEIAEFYNCAVRGIGWINTGNNGETFADMMALFTGDKTSINLVTVMLGINDYISSETLGTTESAENDGTISGAIRGGLKYICQNYPNAKVVVISPLNSKNHGNENNGWSRNTRLTLPGTLQDVCDMIAYWCNVYGVRYINEISDSFINNYNISSYLKDKLHPTDEGQWMLAYELAEKIF